MPVRHVFSAANCHGFSRSAALSCAVTAFASPTSATSAGTFVPISSAAMSIWMTRTFGLKRGGRPKCRIQLSRAPISSTRSAFCSTYERAGADGERVVVRHDALAHRRRQERQLRRLDERAHLVFRARVRRALADDRPAAAPPTSAPRPPPRPTPDRRRSAARPARGGRCGAGSSSHLPLMMSPGRSRYTGPGRP